MAQEMVVYHNGEMKPASQVGISIYDRGFLYGDAVFDATRTFGGKTFRLDRHIDRLYNSLRYLRIDVGMGKAEMTEITEAVVAHNHPLLPAGQDMWVMQRISRGVEAPNRAGGLEPTIIIESHAIPFAARAALYRDGARINTPSVPRVPPPLFESARQDAQLPEPHHGRAWRRTARIPTPGPSCWTNSAT